MKTMLLTLLTLILNSTPSYSNSAVNPSAEIRKAFLYSFENKTDKPDFNFERNVGKDSSGNITENTFFRYPDGKLAFTENLVLSPEGRVVSYFYDQKQIGQRIWLTVSNKTVMKFKKEWYENEKVKKTQEETEEYKPTSHIAMEIEPLTRKMWDSLTSGNSYKFKLIVMEHVDTFSFELEYEGLKELNGKQVHTFALFPRSIFIKLLVRPIRFYYDTTPLRKLVEVHGTLPVKPWNGKEWDGIFEGIMRPTY